MVWHQRRMGTENKRSGNGDNGEYNEKVDSSYDINADKIAYLLKLLGKDKSQHTPEEDSNSEYEDIDEEQEEIKMLVSSRLANSPIVKDTLITDTSEVQDEVESVIKSIYQEINDQERSAQSFNFLLHQKYFKVAIFVPLSGYFVSYDANHGWMLYWLINFQQLITNGAPTAGNVCKQVSKKIKTLIVEDGLGGISGGLSQLGHAAALYSSVLCLALVKDYKTLDGIRPNVYKWFMNSLKNDDGSFLMYESGETDVRSTYCVLVVASLLNILTDELVEGTLEWISKCQTFEGGFAGVPHAEAHGGYTFCAVASYLLLLGKKEGDSLYLKLNQYFDVEALIRWCTLRQYALEGGLSGRTNKLVDACYSFWIGGVFAILELAIGVESIFDRDGLRCYILNCCQDSRGGLRDKPGKLPDFYHLNYTTLGLSVCDNHFELNTNANTSRIDDYAYRVTTKPIEKGGIIGNNPIFGLPKGVGERCKAYFENKGYII